MRIPRNTKTTGGEPLENGIYIIDVRERSILATKLSKDNARRVLWALAEGIEEAEL